MILPQFRHFALEEWQSRWEQQVTHQLADSGVRAPTLRELEELGLELAPLLEVPLHYPEVNGTAVLRERIAGLLPDASPDGTLVTVGAAEAGAIVVDTLTRPGDEVAVLSPSYPQVEGLLRNRGCRVRTFRLDPDRAWALDPDELARAVTPATRLIAICNPNNPTGRVLAEPEVAALVAAAERCGSVLLVDEVYRGTEHDGAERPSLYGRTERTVVLGSLSKAYGLPGLRLGWVQAPVALVDDLWRRHEYATISAATTSMAIAEQVLLPGLRDRLLGRSRALIGRSLATLTEWLGRDGSALRWVPPEAASFAFLRLPEGIDGDGFAARLRDEASVLVAPGSAFGHADHLRLTYALDPDRLDEALDRIARQLTGVSV
ncbi:MAG: pyridoxal phosphate-dependent aminotransferase [Candidatus Dormiibacterota bacterium]